MPRMKFISTHFIIMSSVVSSLSLAQQQIPNSSFEDWQEIRSEVFEPTYWNSIKNTDGGKTTNRLAPEVTFKSSTVHSGNYAVRLVNEKTFGIIANGMITTGAIHGEMDKSKSYVYSDTLNADFSMPFTGRPDSLTGWYMYTPAENDSAMAVILLHDGYVTMPDHGTKSHWVGGVKLILPSTKGNWKRFSAPFFYVKKTAPKYLLMVLSSGNRQQAVEGSEAFFDDLKLIYNKH